MPIIKIKATKKVNNADLKNCVYDNEISSISTNKNRTMQCDTNKKVSEKIVNLIQKIRKVQNSKYNQSRNYSENKIKQITLNSIKNQN